MAVVAEVQTHQKNITIIEMATPESRPADKTSMYNVT